MFDFIEEALDQIAIPVDCRIETSPCCGCYPTGHDGFCSRRSDGIHGALTVIALVGEDMTRFEASQKRLDLRDVIALAACQNEPDWVAQGVGGGMHLGAQASF